MFFGALNQSHVLNPPEHECKSCQDGWQHLKEPLSKARWGSFHPSRDEPWNSLASCRLQVEADDALTVPCVRTEGDEGHLLLI